MTHPSALETRKEDVALLTLRSRRDRHAGKIVPWGFHNVDFGEDLSYKVNLFCRQFISIRQIIHLQSGHCPNRMSSRHVSWLRNPGTARGASGLWHPLSEGDYMESPHPPWKNRTCLGDPEDQSLRGAPKHTVPRAPVGFPEYSMVVGLYVAGSLDVKASAWKIPATAPSALSSPTGSLGKSSQYHSEI